MKDIEALKAEVKKLSAQAIKLKMDLHDLAEELPEGWPRILELATETQRAFAILEDKRKQLAEATAAAANLPTP